MKNEVLIRTATADDFDQLLDLFTEVAEERVWIGTEPGFNRDAYRLGWKRLTEDQSGFLIIALDGESLVGTLSAHPDSEHGCEVGMLVKSSHRGKGIGSALLREAIRWARERGEPSLRLLVFPHNATAIGLYERYGFKKEKRIERFKRRQTGETWDVIVMSLELDSA